MTQEDKELLLKDLCARLPYDPFIKIGNNPNLFKLSTRLNWIVHYGIDGTIEEAITDNQSICKPYLRPMSSMTEEECKELGELPVIIENVCETLPNVPYYIEVAKPEQLDWLNAHHFDYRGLIEKGLALEAPVGMYKF